jgi:hypothetical protein
MQHVVNLRFHRKGKDRRTRMRRCQPPELETVTLLQIIHRFNQPYDVGVVIQVVLDCSILVHCVSYRCFDP